MKSHKMTFAAAILVGVSVASLLFTACGSKTADNDYLTSGTYEFEKSLYTNPISDVLYMDGNGQKYIINLDKEIFAIVNSDSGEADNEYNIKSQEPTKVDKSVWKDRFMKDFAVDIKEHKSCYEYTVNEIYSIFTIDKEVWLASKRTNKDRLGDFMSIIKIKYSDQSTDYKSVVTGYIMDGIDVPESVSEAAKAYTTGKFESTQKEFRECKYCGWRVESLKHNYTYDNFKGLKLEIYQMNYELRSDAPDKVTLVGGMYRKDNNWVCTTYPDCTYLIFKRKGDTLTYLSAMMENDTAPGDDTFGSDMAAVLKNEEFIEQ